MDLEFFIWRFKLFLLKMERVKGKDWKIRELLISDFWKRRGIVKLKI